MNPLLKAKRRAGKVKRWITRKFYERNIGKQYKAWLVEAHTTTPGSVTFSTTISIVIPVYNPPIQFLKECIDSVKNQTATNWQLIVSNDGSTNQDVNDYLTNLEKEKHPQITILTNPNGGISAAINAGLRECTGEYFGMLDHDDRLDPRCVEVFSQAIDTNFHPVAIYSDEDKINTNNEHSELYCKPDFSPELLLSQMYLCHFTIWKTSMVKEAGGLRTQMDGAQDFDLALRLIPELTKTPKSVIHIPLPLYHWRTWEHSTARSIEAKPWAQQAAQKAQQHYLNTTFGGGTAEPSSVQGLNEIHPETISKKELTLVSVIIPTIGTKNTKGNSTFVADAIASLKEKETQTTIEFIVVTTGELPPIPGTDQQVVYNPTNGFNFSEAINLGAKHASVNSDYLLLLNDDTTAESHNPATRLLELAQINNVAAVGAKLTYPNGNLQHAGIVLLPSGPTHPYIGKSGKDYGYFGATLTPRNYCAVTAAAMLVSKKEFDAVNGFDTEFAKDFNDVDFCLRLRENSHRIAWTPYAHFIHHEGASLTRKAADAKEQQLFNDRWQNKYQVDPYYSPALNQELHRIYEAL
jgi:GT2 family glycosyltransferase